MWPSAYKAMWLFAMFDLPVYDAERRRKYTRFRTLLLKEGFSMLQFSVYARYFPGEAAATTVKNRIEHLIPEEGQVRLLMVTEKQFAKMEVFFGKTRHKAEAPPDQLVLF